MNRIATNKPWRSLTTRVLTALAAVGVVLLSSSSAFASDELINQINSYRISKGLPAIPKSPSLSFVAAKHVAELNLYRPASMHSWFGFPYDPMNPSTYPVMWNKPRELTTYRGNGYEIAYFSSGTATPAGALGAWKASTPHHDVLLSRGIWASRTWRAMGAAVQGNYAVVWFGEEVDSVSSPEVRQVKILNEVGRTLMLKMKSADPARPYLKYFTLGVGGTATFYIPVDRPVVLSAENDGTVQMRGSVVMQHNKTHVARTTALGAWRGPDGITHLSYSIGWTVRP